MYNPGSSAANIQVLFLERKSSNPTPLVYNDSVPAGDTRRYVNAVETLFGVQKFGALRVTSTTSVVVNARIYSLPVGGDDKDTVGQFFAAIPASFALKSGQSTDLLGLDLSV